MTGFNQRLVWSVQCAWLEKVNRGFRSCSSGLILMKLYVGYAHGSMMGTRQNSSQ